ncbi:hypothetical protein D3C86_1688090 [compost metagenome]
MPAVVFTSWPVPVIAPENAPDSTVVVWVGPLPVRVFSVPAPCRLRRVTLEPFRSSVAPVSTVVEATLDKKKPRKKTSAACSVPPATTIAASEERLPPPPPPTRMVPFSVTLPKTAVAPPSKCRSPPMPKTWPLAAATVLR